MYFPITGFLYIQYSPFYDVLSHRFRSVSFTEHSQADIHNPLCYLLDLVKPHVPFLLQAQHFYLFRSV